jgi:hypothetical protein
MAFIAVTGTQDPRVPGLPRSRAKVRDALLKQKAVDAAREKAVSLAASFKSGDFAAAAKTAGLDVKTTEQVARGSALPDVGASEAVDAAVFALPVGGVTDPIATDNGVVMAKVTERHDVTPQDIAQGRNALREQLLNERRNRFFSAYMTKAKQKMKIGSTRRVEAGGGVDVEPPNLTGSSYLPMEVSLRPPPPQTAGHCRRRGITRARSWRERSGSRSSTRRASFTFQDVDRVVPYRRPPGESFRQNRFPANFLDWRRQSDTVEHLSAMQW